MKKIIPTEEEIARANFWLTQASRFMADLRGYHKTCKRRACRSAQKCCAPRMHANRKKNACGRPLQKGDAAHSFELMMFGILVDIGMIGSEKELHADETSR